jgi:hypothetical protein
MKMFYFASLIVGMTALLAFGDAVTTVVPAGWTQLATASWVASLGNQVDSYGGISSVRVNRLTGDVYIMASSYGVWKSSNQGSTYTRLDPTMVGGRCENSGGAFQIDQNNPVRMAVFSLDFSDVSPSLNAGMTADGTNWTKINASPAAGRGFDFGSVDWATPIPKVLFAAAHESGGVNEVSTDGGLTWKPASEGFGSNANASNEFGLGVMDATTLIYSAGNGIKRSTNLGANWTLVTSLNSSIRIPVLFNGKHYLGETKLLVSADKGATWTQQGTALPGGDKMYCGPWFGADANTMVVEGVNNIYKTTNGGTSWAAISTTPNNQDFYSLNPNWFGCGTWDPINNYLYATAMNCYAYKKSLGPVNVKLNIAASSLPSPASVSRIHANADGHVVLTSGTHSGVSYDIAGHLVSGRTIKATASMNRVQ